MSQADNGTLQSVVALAEDAVAKAADAVDNATAACKDVSWAVTRCESRAGKAATAARAVKDVRERAISKMGVERLQHETVLTKQALGLSRKAKFAAEVVSDAAVVVRDALLAHEANFPICFHLP